MKQCFHMFLISREESDSGTLPSASSFSFLWFQSCFGLEWQLDTDNWIMAALGTAPVPEGYFPFFFSPVLHPPSLPRLIRKSASHPPEKHRFYGRHEKLKHVANCSRKDGRETCQPQVCHCLLHITWPLFRVSEASHCRVWQPWSLIYWHHFTDRETVTHLLGVVHVPAV